MSLHDLMRIIKNKGQGQVCSVNLFRKTNNKQSPFSYLRNAAVASVPEALYVETDWLCIYDKRDFFSSKRSNHFIFCTLVFC